MKGSGKPQKESRRGFLKKSTTLAAAGCCAPMFVPNYVFSAPGKPGPNDRIQIGFIGAGRRARQLMGMPPDAQIVAVSDVNKIRMEETASDKGWKKFQDYRELLASDAIDAVVVATPDHWHTLNSIHACQAGKDVYCEKPMTLTISEGRALVKAVRKHKRVFQTGSQQRSMEECRFGCELVRNQRLGKVHTIHGHCYPSPWHCDLPGTEPPDGLDWDMWLGQTSVRPYHPDLYLPRANPGWISFRAYSGGEMTGWGSHGLDIVQWALGTDESGPVEVWPEGKGLNCPVGFRYANGVQLILDRKDYPGGAVFEGDKGRIIVARAKYQADPPELAKEPVSGSEITLPKTPGHMQNWLDCIRTRERPIADVEMGHRSATMCHLGNIARWAGRRLQWDPVKERFTGDDQANEYLQRPMREPWQIKI